MSKVSPLSKILTLALLLVMIGLLAPTHAGAANFYAATESDRATAINASITIPDYNIAAFTNHTPGVTIWPDSSPAFPPSPHIAENGSRLFTITLNSQPAAPVTIPLSVSDPSQCGVSTPSVTLDAATWNTGVTFFVSGVIENIMDGDQPCDLQLGTITSADPDYDALTAGTSPPSPITSTGPTYGPYPVGRIPSIGIIVYDDEIVATRTVPPPPFPTSVSWPFSTETQTFIVGTPVPPLSAQTATAKVGDPAISKIGFLLPGQTGVVGEQLEWIITVSNGAAAQAVTVTDTLIPALRVDYVEAPGSTVNVSGQTVTVTTPLLNPNQVYIFSVFTTVLDGVQVDNTACISGTAICATGQVARALPRTGSTPWWRIWMLLLLGTLLVSFVAKALMLYQRRHLP